MEETGMRVRASLLSIATLLTVAGPSLAAPIITVGSHDLLPNTPGQMVQIYVSGGDAVEGLNLYAQVGDGGPAEGGTIVGPSITADILSGTIFAANNSGADSTGSSAQLAVSNTLTASDTVDADGLLATLTLDTTGFFSGSWGLFLSDTLNGPTDFAGIEADIFDGSITIIPEPAAAILIPLCILLARGPSRNECD
jgi:hypothetical protein